MNSLDTRNNKWTARSLGHATMSQPTWRFGGRGFVRCRGRRLLFSPVYLLYAVLLGVVLAVEPQSLGVRRRTSEALTDSTFFGARDAWFTNEASATSSYGHIRDWDVSRVTDMEEGESPVAEILYGGCGSMLGMGILAFC